MSNETKVTYLPISAIKVDPACQAREALNAKAVGEYREIMMREGTNDFPPIVVFHDGPNYWLSDGFHRYAAAQKVGLHVLKAEISKGSRRDAILHAVGANATHGLRRTNADKRRAVSVLLEDEEWGSWSNREIARRCGVDEWLVRKLREEQASVSPTAGKPQTARKVERNGKAYAMETGNIGQKDGVKSPSHQLRDSDKATQDGDHAKHQTAATDQRAVAGAHDDALSLTADARSSENAQLQELMSMWSRASEEVRQKFLASIRVSLASRNGAGAALGGPQASGDTEPSPSQTAQLTPSQTAQLTEAEQDNVLFEMWKGLKPNTQVCGRQWVEVGCPDEPLANEHWISTEKLVPFRAAAKGATQEQREQFLELTQAA